MKDLFSSQAELYARYRPAYPPELYAWILKFVRNRDNALDCATGNGQVARSLAEHFHTVCAIDISASQLRHAVSAYNIVYSVSRAESTPFAADTFDLITVAQAYHWFDGPAFWKEVKRIARPEAIVAIWSYDVSEERSPVTDIIRRWNFETLAPYWDPERRHIYNRYNDLIFEFDRIPTPGFQIVVEWTFEELVGHLRTWSALQKMLKEVGDGPFQSVISEIQSAWGGDTRKRIVFPLSLHLGKVRR